MSDDQILALVYPDLAVRWRRVYSDLLRLYNKAIKPTEGLRSEARQLQLWQQGRKLINGTWKVIGPTVTRARPGDSIHLYGLALDSCFTGADPYLTKLEKKERDFLWHEYGRLCQAHGLVWGGDWNGNGIEDKNDFDKPHCQITYGLTLDQIKELYHFNKNLAVWHKIDQIRGIR